MSQSLVDTYRSNGGSTHQSREIVYMHDEVRRVLIRVLLIRTLIPANSQILHYVAMSYYVPVLGQEGGCLTRQWIVT
eukprot:scaffold269699_cov53-Attheya_sp.AAC.1